MRIGTNLKIKNADKLDWDNSQKYIVLTKHIEGTYDINFYDTKEEAEANAQYTDPLTDHIIFGEGYRVK